MIIDSPKLLFKNSKCEMMHKINVIYRMKNLINDKIYIGKTGRELRIRIHEHIYSNKDYPIEKAVKKYGIENFDIEVIAEADTEEELDALEKFFIEFYGSKKPYGYNLTDGAEGCCGLVFTEQHREKIAAKAKLRKHSQETKDKISRNKKGQRLGIPLKKETVEKMIANSTLSKKVICIETGVIFTSIRAAARWLKINDENVRKACHGKNITAGGYHWSFVDENGNPTRTEFKSRTKEIRCIETGKVFKSAKEAAKFAGVGSYSITSACNGNHATAGGYHWEYTDGSYANSKKQLKRPAKRKVICEETGEIFNMIADAAKWAGVERSSICEVCRGNRKMAGGYHWKYADEEN